MKKTGKPDFFVLKRPAYPLETREFWDARLGICFDLTMQALDKPRQIQAEELAGDLITKYIGFPDEDTAKAIAPTDTFPAHIEGGDPLVLSDLLLRRAANLFSMYQPPANEEEAFTVEEFIQLSATSPEIWDALLEFRNDLVQKADNLRKNANGEPATSGTSA